MTTRLALAALVLLAAAIRAAHLDSHSLWSDEGLSFYRATKDLAFILSGRIDVGLTPTRDVQPPLYFLLLSGWLKALTVSPWAAKLFSLGASLPAVAAVWALARRLAGRRAAWPAAMFAALSPVYAWYAQEVRSYSLLVTIAVLSLYALVRWMSIPRGSARASSRWLVAALALAATAMWVHYLGVFLIAVELLALVASAVMARGRASQRTSSARAGTRRDWRIPVAAVVILLAAAPLVPFAAERLRLGAERDQHFVPLATIARDVVLHFTLGVDAWATASWLVLALFAVALTGAVRAWRRDAIGSVVLVLSIGVPVLGLFALTTIKPVYMGARHILLASPAWYVALGAGVAIPAASASGSGSFRPLARVAAVCGTAAILVAMLVADRRFVQPASAQGKDDLRALAEYVRERAQPGDVLLLSDPVLAHVFEVYLPEMPVTTVPQPGDLRPAEEQFAALGDAPRIWFMTPGPDEEAWLKAHRGLVLRENFPGSSIPVRVDAWDPLPADAGLSPVTGAQPDGAGTRVTGWRAGSAVGGQPLRVHLGLAEEGSGEPPARLTASMRVLDGLGREVARVDQPLRPADGEPERLAAVDLNVPPLAAGAYDLMVALYESAEEQGSISARPATDGTVGAAAAPMYLGPIAIQEAVVPVPPEPRHALSARGGGWRVAGYESLPAEIDAASHSVGVWVVRDGDETAARRLRLSVLNPPNVNGARNVIGTGETELPGDLPSGHARLLLVSLSPPNSQLTLNQTVTLGVSLEGDAGTIPLERTWLERLSGRVRGDNPTMARLDDVAYVPVPPVVGPAITGAELDSPVAFGGIGHLLAAAPVSGTDPRNGTTLADAGAGQVPAVWTASAGDTVAVRLVWNADQPDQRDIRVSVQLIPPAGSADGRPVAQDDGPPAHHEFERPTSGWRNGEAIDDLRLLTLPPDLAPGEYTVAVAVYDAGPRGGRLEAASLPAGWDDAATAGPVSGEAASPAAAGGAAAGVRFPDDLVPVGTVRVVAR